VSTEHPRATTLVREELDDLKALVAFELRAAGVAEPYSARLAMLRDELDAAFLVEMAAKSDDPLVQLRLSRGKDMLVGLPARLLGRALDIWQTLYDALGQAATNRITRAGPIPDEVIAQTRLVVEPFTTGSFVIQMRLPHGRQMQLVEEEDLGLKAFVLLEELLGAGEDKDALIRVLHQLKGRVVSAYACLLELCEAEAVDVSVKLARRDATEVSVARLPAYVARRVLTALRLATEASHESLCIEGALNAANVRTGSFEVDLGEEGTLSGKEMNVGTLLRGLEIGRRYHFDLVQVVLQDRATGEYENKHLLSGVKSLD